MYLDFTEKKYLKYLSKLSLETLEQIQKDIKFLFIYDTANVHDAISFNIQINEFYERHCWTSYNLGELNKLILEIQIIKKNPTLFSEAKITYKLLNLLISINEHISKFVIPELERLLEIVNLAINCNLLENKIFFKKKK